MNLQKPHKEIFIDFDAETFRNIQQQNLPLYPSIIAKSNNEIGFQDELMETHLEKFESNRGSSIHRRK